MHPDRCLTHADDRKRGGSSFCLRRMGKAACVEVLLVSGSKRTHRGSAPSGKAPNGGLGWQRAWMRSPRPTLDPWARAWFPGLPPPCRLSRFRISRRSQRLSLQKETQRHLPRPAPMPSQGAPCLDGPTLYQVLRVDILVRQLGGVPFCKRSWPPLRLRNFTAGEQPRQ